MIFQNIDFHNVEQMTPVEGGGYRMWRVPEQTRAACNEGLRETSASYTCGVELRFVMKSETADVHLRVLPDEEAQIAFLYYGSIQGGCSDTCWNIGVEETVIQIRKPKNMDALRKISEDASLPFSPEAVRLVLPYGVCVFMGIEGDVEPPTEAMYPKKRYLAYGSSITHGSLALGTPHTYAFRLGQKLGMDYFNKGFAGGAHLEKEMAEYLCSLKNWDVATVELGINMLHFTDEEFEKRVDDFTAILAADGRPVFATSIFCFNDDRQEKAARFRKIVKKYAEPRLTDFKDGLELLGNPAHISHDMVHPSLEGVEDVVNNWYAAIQSKLK